MSQDNLQNLPMPHPDNAPNGLTGTQRLPTAEELAIINSAAKDYFYLQVTYTDQDEVKTGYISQYVDGGTWSNYVIITDAPQTQFLALPGGQWLSNVNESSPLFLCVTASPRYWVYLSNYYTDVKWNIENGKLFCDSAPGAAGCQANKPSGPDRVLWVTFNTEHVLRDCKMIPA